MKPVAAIANLLFLAGTVMFAQSQDERRVAVVRLQVVVAPVIQSIAPAPTAHPLEVTIPLQTQQWEIRQIKSELRTKNATTNAVLETTILVSR